jgi:hypothetical protein
MSIGIIEDGLKLAWNGRIHQRGQLSHKTMLPVKVNLRGAGDGTAVTHLELAVNAPCAID